MSVTIDQSTKFGKQVTDRLAREQIAWLTTVDSRGVPQPNPVWFVWQEGLIYIYSEPNQAKLVNIRRNPGVAVHLNTIGGGNVIVLTGTAEIVDRATLPVDVTQEYVNKYGQAITSGGWTLENMPAQYSETIRIVPGKLRGF